jgi:hypothetical protein
MTLVGAGLGLSSLIEMSDLPQRVQYLRIGLFALPQLAQVLNEHSSPQIHAMQNNETSPVKVFYCIN